MTAYQVAASTLGQENRSERGEALTYYYRGDPARTGGSRHFRGPQPEPEPKVAGTLEERAQARRERIAAFAAALEQARAPGKKEYQAIAEAGEAVGVARETARAYAKELREQGLEGGPS